MLIIFKNGASAEQVEKAYRVAQKRALKAIKIESSGITAISLNGKTESLDVRDFLLLDGVRDVIRTEDPYKLAGLERKKGGTVIDFGSFQIGGKEMILIAGPCAVESKNQIHDIASQISALGVKILRGGAFKPRTSPYSFQGLGEEGLKYLKQAAEDFGMRVISEIPDASNIPMAEEYCDILQVGARNMQNFSLLKKLGEAKRPVLLKRGMSATINELLLTAEYLMSGGNEKVILCERGIRTFENSTRNTMDISAIPKLKSLTHLPVIADPSHGTGHRELVPPMARAAAAAGADGIILEVHNESELALSDGAQSIYIHQLEKLIHQLKIIATSIDRTIS